MWTFLVNNIGFLKIGAILPWKTEKKSIHSWEIQHSTVYCCEHQSRKRSKLMSWKTLIVIMLHFHTPGHHILNNHAPFSLQMIEQQRAKYYITATKYDGRLTALRKKQTAYAKLVWDTILHLAYLRNPDLSYPSINDGNTCIIRKHSSKRRGLLIQTLYLRYLHQQTGLKLRVGSSCSMNERMIEEDLF